MASSTTVDVTYPDGSTRRFFNVRKVNYDPGRDEYMLEFMQGEQRYLRSGCRIEKEEKQNLVGGKQ